MGIPLEGESGGGVPGDGLEVADGLAALGEERETAMPRATQIPLRVAAQLLHKALLRIPRAFGFASRFACKLQEKGWTRRDSNS